MEAEITVRLQHFFSGRTTKAHSEYVKLLTNHTDRGKAAEIESLLKNSMDTTQKEIQEITSLLLANFTDIYNMNYTSAGMNVVKMHDLVQNPYRDRMSLLWFQVANSDLYNRRVLGHVSIHVNMLTNRSPLDWVFMPNLPNTGIIPAETLISDIVKLLFTEYQQLAKLYTNSISRFTNQLVMPHSPSIELLWSKALLDFTLRDTNTRVTKRIEGFPTKLKTFLEENVQMNPDVFELMIAGYSYLYDDIKEIGLLASDIKYAMTVADYEDNVSKMALNV